MATHVPRWRSVAPERYWPAAHTGWSLHVNPPVAAVHSPARYLVSTQLLPRHVSGHTMLRHVEHEPGAVVLSPARNCVPAEHAVCGRHFPRAVVLLPVRYWREPHAAQSRHSNLLAADMHRLTRAVSPERCRLPPGLNQRLLFPAPL